MTTAAGPVRAFNLILLLTFGLMLIEWLYVRLALHDADSHDLKETTTSIVTAPASRRTLRRTLPP